MTRTYSIYTFGVMEKPFGKIVLVTGASRGIGRAVVETLLELDPEVIVYGVARTEEPLRDIQEKYGSRFNYVVTDVTDTERMRELVCDLVDIYGRINSVVANAGVLAPVSPISCSSTKEWERHFAVNFFSIVSLVTMCLPHLEATRGSIICVSSGASVKPYNGWSCYCASKAALNSYVRSLALEIPGIRTIAVAPGVVDTQMQTDIRLTLGPQGMAPEALKRFTDLKNNNQLLDPRVPGTVYAKLVLNGIPNELNGAYVRYNDERLNV